MGLFVQVNTWVRWPRGYQQHDHMSGQPSAFFVDHVVGSKGGQTATWSKGTPSVEGQGLRQKEIEREVNPRREKGREGKGRLGVILVGGRTKAVEMGWPLGGGRVRHRMIRETQGGDPMFSAKSPGVGTVSNDVLQQVLLGNRPLASPTNPSPGHSLIRKGGSADFAYGAYLTSFPAIWSVKN